MTLLSFTRTNASRPALAGSRRVRAGGAARNAGRIISGAAAVIGRPIVILVANRAALKRFETRVKGDLFDDPVFWAELKSAAWAEATRHK